MSLSSVKGLLCAVVSVAMFSASAKADDLLLIDLSVPNQITLTATAGLSAATASGGDITGVYMENFYSGPRLSGISDTLVPGATLTNAENPASTTQNLFTSGLVDQGLNFYNWSTASTVTFTSGSLAFIGTATWTVPADDYAELVAGNTSGDLYFPADDITDLSSAQILGTWRVVPEPGTMLLCSFGLAAFARRRRSC